MPSAAVSATRELLAQCPLHRRELAAPLTGALARLGRMSEAEHEAKLAMAMRFIGTHRQELDHALAGVGCSLVPLEKAPSRTQLQAFDRATWGALDVKALEALRTEPGWLGAVANAWLAAGDPDAEARRTARLAVEALAGERGSLEQLAIPEGYTSTESSWQLTPLDHAALLTAGAHLVRVTDERFRPKLALTASAFAASPDGAWVATWQEDRGSLFHSASGVEAAQFHCPFKITAVVLNRDASELYLTHVRKTITRLPVDGSVLPRVVNAAPEPLAPPPLPTPAQPLRASAEPPRLLARGSALVVASDAGLLLIDDQQRVAFRALPHANKADFSENVALALIDNLYRAWLLRVDHPEPALLTIPGNDPRSYLLSPHGTFVATRKPVGPWNGRTNVRVTPSGRVVTPDIESYGTLFFDSNERLYYFNEASDLLRVDPKTARHHETVAPALGSYLGTLSSSRNDFLSWQMEDLKPEISVNLASGKLTPWQAFDADGHGVTSGIRLVDVSSDGSLALLDLEGSYSLQRPGQQLQVVEARRALFMPKTNDLAVVTHTSGVDLRSIEGELQLQVLLEGSSYVVRGKDFSSSGKLDPQLLRCRVGRHFLPAELCWSRL